MNRIDFLCVGAQKSGTTTLRAYLRKHSRLDVPDHEPHFFDNEEFDWVGNCQYDEYHKSFKSQFLSRPQYSGACDLPIDNTLLGEVTPIYMYWHPCVQRIYKYNPNIKLIFVLRNPMQRAYSHWAMEYERGAESLSFSEAIRKEEGRCAKAKPFQHRVYSYVDRGFYFRQISRFLDYFPSENILILSSDTLFNEPRIALQKISHLLGISPFAHDPPLHYRKGVYPQALSVDDYSYIYERLSGDIDSLSRVVEWDLSSWRQQGRSCSLS